MLMPAALTSRPARISAIVVAALLAAVLLGLAILWGIQRDQILPNTWIAEIEVSGMTAAEATDAILPMAEARETDEVVFAFQGSDYPLVPREVGFRVDVDATVDAALQRGREGFLRDVGTRLAAFRTADTIDLIEIADEAVVAAWVDNLAGALDRPEIDGGVTIDPEDATVTAELAQGLVEVDRTATTELALAAIEAPGAETFDLPAATTPQRLTDETVEAAAEQAAEALAEPLILRAADASLELTPRDLARLLEFEEQGEVPGAIDLALIITPEQLEEELGELARDRFDVEPTRASYRTNRTPPVSLDAQLDVTFRPVSSAVEVIPGRQGWAFDAELAAPQLTEVVRTGAREVEVRREQVDGDFPTARAEELRPTRLLGTFTTYYQAGLERNENIRRLADVIDGALVLPGAQFSIDAISGPRSCEQGYLPGGTIVRGELVDTCGGGISQFGTTMLNAAFFAGVQLDEWKAHSWYISRYPVGREATLYYPYLDVKFTNNTPGAILVKTSHTSTSVTVSIHGVPRATAVSARHGERTEPRTFTTEVRDTSELRRGQEEVLQPGQDGFTITVERIVELVGGGTDNRTITTVYDPQTRIIERGTAGPAPAPPVDEDDDEDDDDEDEDDDG